MFLIDRENNKIKIKFNTTNAALAVIGRKDDTQRKDEIDIIVTIL